MFLTLTSSQGDSHIKGIKILQCFKGWICLKRLLLMTWCPVVKSSILKIGMESVPEMSDNFTLKYGCVPEKDFTEFCHHNSFKTCIDVSQFTRYKQCWLFWRWDTTTSDGTRSFSKNIFIAWSTSRSMRSSILSWIAPNKLCLCMSWNTSLWRSLK